MHTTFSENASLNEPRKNLTPVIFFVRKKMSKAAFSVLALLLSWIAFSWISSPTQPMTQINVSPNNNELSSRLADFVIKASKEAVENHGKFHIAISGGELQSINLSQQGSLPGLLAAKLREAPYNTQVDWAKWVVWFVDERYVALDHNDSNFKYG